MKILRLGILFFIFSLITGCLEASRKAPSNIANKYGNKVVLYSTSWCGYCKKTRELFVNRRVDFIEIDIEASNEGRREFDALQGRGVPMVLMKGRIVDGYAPKAHLKLIFDT